MPLSALEHHIYCPRQCALIHVDGVWTDNRHTVAGTAGHRRVDTARDRVERGLVILRHVPLWSEELGLTGRADALQLSPATGAVVPVEYKMGRPHGDAARVQLCAQALCLEEMTGSRVTTGYLWYGTSRRRQRVQIDEPLRALTLATIADVRRAFRAQRLPSPVDDARCASCQLLDHCQPELSAQPDRVSAYLASALRCGF